ncbi:MAG: hypothetical protein KGS10_05660 [Chloroflexi bacterium]|nr:hypothetical protein [Chloroflexota bacterium]
MERQGVWERLYAVEYELRSLNRKLDQIQSMLGMLTAAQGSSAPIEQREKETPCG